MTQTKQTTLCKLRDLGKIDYSLSYQIQQQTLQEVIRGGTDTLLLCEHDPIFTLGRLATTDNFLLAEEKIKKEGAQIVRIDRGGEVTFHGPGQLVIYPVFQMQHFGKDLKLYMNKLEQVAIDLLRHFDIVANSIHGRRGVWVGKKKITSIGIGVRKWVTFHGLAINVNTDLRFFSMIKPCGLDVDMTSMLEIKGREIDLQNVKKQVASCFASYFDLTFV